jgi:hypothetical protein
VNVIQTAFDDSNHASLNTLVGADADKDDLISNMEARRKAGGRPAFTEWNDILVYDGFPNGGDTRMIRTIRKQIALRDNNLFLTAMILVKPKFPRFVSIVRHRTPHRAWF